METVKAAEALDARPRGVRVGQRVVPTPAVPGFRKSFPTLSLRLRVLPLTFHIKGRVGRAGGARLASERLPTTVRLCIRYGTGTSEAQNAELSGGFWSTAGGEYHFDADRKLGTGPLEAAAHTEAVSVALGGLGWPRDVCGRLRRSGGDDLLTTSP